MGPSLGDAEGGDVGDLLGLDVGSIGDRVGEPVGFYNTKEYVLIDTRKICGSMSCQGWQYVPMYSSGAQVI